MRIRECDERGDHEPPAFPSHPTAGWALSTNGRRGAQAGCRQVKRKHDSRRPNRIAKAR